MSFCFVFHLFLTPVLEGIPIEEDSIDIGNSTAALKEIAAVDSMEILAGILTVNPADI